MGSEIVATFTIEGEEVTIYGCFDNETLESQFDFYDVYNASGECLNIGQPLELADVTLDTVREIIRTAA
mgnify:CR=1 FL=1